MLNWSLIWIADIKYFGVYVKHNFQFKPKLQYPYKIERKKNNGIENRDPNPLQFGWHNEAVVVDAKTA